MTPKQKKFADEYLVDLNATQAAIRAGYSEQSASVQACKLLKKGNIASYINTKREVLAEKSEIDAVWVLKNLQEVAEKCMTARPVMKWDYGEKCLVQETVTDQNGDEVGVYQFDSQGANRALELIGKHLGMFTDKLQIEGKLLSMEHVPIDILQKILAGAEDAEVVK